MSLIAIKIKSDRPNGFGFKIRDEGGLLLVSDVSTDGAAYECGIRCGDIIHSINGVEISVDTIGFVLKMNEIRGEVQLSVYRDDVPLPRSSSNISDDFDQNSINSYEKMTTSTSSINFNVNGTNKRVTSSNYVPEEHINNYMQPMNTYENVDKISDDSPDPITNQITRKQAYKKPTTELGSSEAPKLNFKRATKSPSVYSAKEIQPSFTVKRKTNSRMSDVSLTSSLNMSQGMRRSIPANIVPIQATTILNSTPSPSINQIVLQDTDIKSSIVEKQSSSILSLNEVVQVETDIKITSFKGKLKKTGWCPYRIEDDTLGVIFHCLTTTQTTVASNSTAIDPCISGLEFYMTLWHSNNTISKFFLPIGQQSYDDDIDIQSNMDNIFVKFAKNDVEFVINYSRLESDKIELLFKIMCLKYETPEPRLPPVKPKRIHGSMDNVYSTRKVKPPKNSSELPRDSQLCHLPQTKLTENVPVVILICINIIEKAALRNEGIYRKSGNESARKRLENVVYNQGVDSWVECEEWKNINTVASLLKSILRNYSLIDRDTAIKLSMINVSSEVNEYQNRMDMIYHLRQHFCKTDTRLDSGTKERSPKEIQCRLETFKYLIRHLHRISQYWDLNKMNAENLATCFSPTMIEDIPFDDDEDYQTSKKSDAEKNLKQMVTFWITNSVLICDLLDEDDDQLRSEKLKNFCTSTISDKLPEEELENTTEEIELLVKEVVESYTSHAFIVESENGSVTLMDGNIFGKAKPSASYPLNTKKKDIPIRRNSANTHSPVSTRRATNAGDIIHESDSSKASFTKRNDYWTNRSVRMKKREPQLPQKKELSLTSMRVSATNKNVPVIVDVCVNIIEQYGINVDGMYRVSGKRHDINVLGGLVAANDYTNWSNESYREMWANTHTVSGLLKSILKRFCLIKKVTWVHMFSQFSEKMEPADVRKVLMAAAYHLRHENKQQQFNILSSGYLERIEKECEDNIRNATLRYVLKHLKRVSEHEPYNRMTSNSLAICFMPVLMEEDDTADIRSISNKGIQITEKLIDHCDWIFQWDDRPSEEMFGKEMTDSLDEYLSTYKSNTVNIELSNTGEDSIAEHVVNSDKVQLLLEKSLAKSYIVAQGRFTLRRHSDETDGSNRKTEYRQSKLFDDSQLPDKIRTTDSDDNAFFNLSLSDNI